MLPFGDYSFRAAVQREGPRLKNEDKDAAAKLVRAQTCTVASDYFTTRGLAMVRGREFTTAEESTAGGTTPVVLFARGLGHTRSPSVECDAMAYVEPT